MCLRSIWRSGLRSRIRPTNGHGCCALQSINAGNLQRRNAVRRYTPLEDAEHIASPEDSETSELLAAVRSLPDKLHEVVVLHYLEGFSVEETARCLRISVSAVKMRLTRGRQAIKALLGTEE